MYIYNFPIVYIEWMRPIGVAKPKENIFLPKLRIFHCNMLNFSNFLIDVIFFLYIHYFACLLSLRLIKVEKFCLLCLIFTGFAFPLLINTFFLYLSCLYEVVYIYMDDNNNNLSLLTNKTSWLYLWKVKKRKEKRLKVKTKQREKTWLRNTSLSVQRC